MYSVAGKFGGPEVLNNVAMFLVLPCCNEHRKAYGFRVRVVKICANLAGAIQQYPQKRILKTMLRMIQCGISRRAHKRCGPKCATFHLKVAHALSTENLVIFPGQKPFTTNCIRATPILASHTSTSLQVNITDPATHTHIANQLYSDIWVHCTAFNMSFIHDDLVSQAPTAHYTYLQCTIQEQ